MHTIEMSLDDDLVEAIDKVAKRLQTSRSEFAHAALRNAVKQYEIKMLEEKHRSGYLTHPVEKGEFSVWEVEQDWGEE